MPYNPDPQNQVYAMPNYVSAQMSEILFSLTHKNLQKRSIVMQALEFPFVAPMITALVARRNFLQDVLKSHKPTGRILSLIHI